MLFGVVGILILSPDSLILRLIDCDNNALLSMRGIFLAIASGCLIAIFPALRRGFRLWPVMAYAAVFTLGFCFFPLSIKHTHVANVLVIIATTPLIAAIGAYFFLHEKTSKATWITAGITAGGVALIFSNNLSGGGLLGNLLAFGSSLSLAINSIIVRRYQSVPIFTGLFIGGLLGGLAFAGIADWQTVDTLDWGLGALNGGVITAVAFMLIIAASRRLPPAEVNLLFLLETVLGPLWVWLVLSEVPPITTFLAAAIILPALAIHAFWSLRSARPVSSV